MPNKKQYHFLFRKSGIPLAFADIVFRNEAYGRFDIRCLYKDKTYSNYLTQKGLKQFEKNSENLRDNAFYNEKIKEMNRVINLLFNTPKIRKGTISFKEAKKIWPIVENNLFELCKVYYYCNEYSLMVFERLIRSEIKDKDEINKIFRNLNLLNNRNYSEELIKSFQKVSVLGKMKLRLHKAQVASFELLYKILATIGKEKSLAVNQCYALRDFEIKQILQGKEILLEEVNKRLSGCVLIPNKKKKWKCLIGKYYVRWKKELEPQTNKISGEIVYPGKARGRVINNSEWTKPSIIPRGTIFVTAMTNPQVVPYLKNAAAIITDEGGITCHAAILAREMKKPCIVGTKIATKVLRNGQLVEVDANKGIVRVIKK